VVTSIEVWPDGVPFTQTWQTLPWGGTGQNPEHEAMLPVTVTGPQTF